MDIKNYHRFTNAMWAYFKKYASGINDDNVWQAIPEANELSRIHCDIINHSGIIEAMIRQLLEIGERERNSTDDGQTRIKRTMTHCRTYAALSHDVASTLIAWLGWLSDLYPEHADMIVDELAKLLREYGMHFSNEELEAYIEAGWMIKG